jgi:hypothetical protein
LGDVGADDFTTASRSALEPTQPPIQWVPGAPSLEVKRPGLEADHSPPSNAEVKNAWNYTSTPPIRLHEVVLSYKGVHVGCKVGLKYIGHEDMDWIHLAEDKL